MLKLNKAPKPTYTDKDLEEAVCLLASECYGAMRFCNSLGGDQSAAWQILHNNTEAEVMADVKTRNISLTELKCAVSGTPVLWSAYIRHALGEITEDERRRIFRKYVKNGEGNWPDPAKL